MKRHEGRREESNRSEMLPDAEARLAEAPPAVPLPDARRAVYGCTALPLSRRYGVLAPSWACLASWRRPGRARGAGSALTLSSTDRSVPLPCQLPPLFSAARSYMLGPKTPSPTDCISYSRDFGFASSVHTRAAKVVRASVRASVK
jgi:hypothetical protein